MKILLETKRLLFRELQASDAEPLFVMDSNPKVHRYLGNQPLKKIEECYGIIEFVRQQYLENGIGRWAVIEKQNGCFIGWAGLKFIKEETNGQHNFYDLGYRFIEDYWGKGYATEASAEIVNYAFNTMKLKELFACAHSENTASKKVLEELKK